MFQTEANTVPSIELSTGEISVTQTEVNKDPSERGILVAVKSSTESGISTAVEASSTGEILTTAEPSSNVNEITAPCTICGQICTTNQMTAEYLNEKLENITRELTMDKTETSAFRRRYTSATDNRPSSIAVGAVGVASLACTLGGIALLDITFLIQAVSKIKVHILNIKSKY